MRWEYHSETGQYPGPDWTDLQELGLQGWELCVAIQGPGGFVRLIFKRPLAD